MPLHSTSRGPAKPKTTSAAGGADRVEGTRSAVTGRKLGRAAARSLAKNAGNAEEYLDTVEAAASIADIQALLADHTFVARVERNPGGGHLKVTLQTGEADTDVSISGTLRFRGSASKKTDRANCFCSNDIIIINAGLAVSKLTSAQTARVRRVFAKHGVSTPRGFFMVGSTADGTEGDDMDGFEFDRSDEERAEAAEAASAAAARARREALRAQARRTLPRINAGGPQDAVAAALDVEAHAAAVIAEARRREEDDAALLFDAPAAGGGGERVGRTGPNRAERRAAEAAAAAEAANADADAGYGGFDLYEDAVLPGNADKGWEELADAEVDIDAI